MIEVERVKHMSVEEALIILDDLKYQFDDRIAESEHSKEEELLEALQSNKAASEALEMAIKSLETIQRIDDVLNVEGMTEIDVLDEIMDAVSEFKYDCGVSE